MTELFQRAFSEIQKLSESAQDELAKQLLAELEDEKAWQERFEATTDSQWTNIAATVRREITAGEISPLDDIFST